MPGNPSASRLVRWFALALATAGGAGFAPVAPGTFGAAIGVGLFVLLVLILPVPAGGGALGLLTASVFAVGCWAASEAERCFQRKDDGRIVIDEVAGQLLTLAPLLWLPWGAGREHSAPWLLGGFALFRLFDIWKPGPVRWAERRFTGGFGVMADDVVAGLLGAVALTAALGAVEARA